MNAPLDLIALVCRAATNTALRDEAITTWRLTSKDIFETQLRDGIRISDSGRCALELWADVHKKLDIPADPELQLTRFDIGTLYGLWIACLTKAALEDVHPEWECDLEPVVTLDGLKGHVDLFVHKRDLDLTPVWVIENKSTYWSGKLNAPHERAFYQVQQAASYGEAKGAPVFTILTIGPAVHGKYDKDVKAWVTPPKMRQDDYATEKYAEAARTELHRLKTALLLTPPPADAKEDWRCKSCQYSGCPQNVNPRNPVGIFEVAS